MNYVINIQMAHGRKVDKCIVVLNEVWFQIQGGPMFQSEILLRMDIWICDPIVFIYIQRALSFCQ